jgi:hypothetical protein
MEWPKKEVYICVSLYKKPWEKHSFRSASIFNTNMSFLYIISIAATILAVPIGIVTIIYARRQLREARKANEVSQSVHQSGLIVGHERITGAPLPPLRWIASQEQDTKVFRGDIPQRPKVFDERQELQAEITAPPTSDTGRVFVAIGIRGVGKSQLAGAIARQRMAAQWRLVAWINAEDLENMTIGLRQVAIDLELCTDQLNTYDAALKVRHWLEVNGDKCLIIFDNATDANDVRRFLPAHGRADIIITGYHQDLSSLGTPVSVGVFSPEQATNFLQARTGIPASAEALGLAGDLGFLPLALSQAAAVIVGRKLDYSTYRSSLAAAQVIDYLQESPIDPYPQSVAAAVVLSLTAVEASGNGAVCRQIMELIAVMSPQGFRRTTLHAVAERGVRNAFIPNRRGSAIGSPQEVEAALQKLAESSLLSWTMNGSAVAVHRLIARIVRERADHERTMPATAKQVIRAHFYLTYNRSLDKVEIREQTDKFFQGQFVARHYANAVNSLLGKIYHDAQFPELLLDEEITYTLSAVENLEPFTRTLSRTSQFGLTMLREGAEFYILGFQQSRLQNLVNIGELQEATTICERFLADAEKVFGANSLLAQSTKDDLAKLQKILNESDHTSPPDMNLSHEQPS